MKYKIKQSKRFLDKKMKILALSTAEMVTDTLNKQIDSKILSCKEYISNLEKRIEKLEPTPLCMVELRPEEWGKIVDALLSCRDEEDIFSLEIYEKIKKAAGMEIEE